MLHSTLLGRYWPLMAAGVALSLLAALFPTVEAGRGSAHLRAGALDGLAGPATQTPTATTTAADATAAAPPTGSGARAAATQTTAGRGDSGIAAPSSVGVARSGVRCGPGVLQVKWSVYAPACLAAYQGYNGGATSHGVTSDTITLSYRRTNSTQDAAVAATAGDALPGTDDQTLADLRTYVDLFNRTYELYGRHVVLKDFQGQGDWLQEYDGQGQPQAAADATAAHDLGAFADVTMYKGSPFYWPALAQQHVITFCCFGYPDSWFEANSPYWYSLWFPTGTSQDRLLASVLCRRMAGMPAAFAGDPATQQRTRAFGYIGADNPWWSQEGDEFVADLASCGGRLVKRAKYTFNFPELQSEATSLMAQMRSAGVTTVICWCDPAIPVFMTQAADQQQYHPEWLYPDWPEPIARLYASDQWSHAITFAHQWLAPDQREAYAVFQLASGGREPAEQYFDYLYQVLVQLFGGLQAAGPNLDPVSFQRGLRSLPTSARGEFGTWSFGPGGFAPFRDSQLTWWDPNGTSEFDGKRGTFESCESATWFPFDDPAALGPPRQLRCFGR